MIQIFRIRLDHYLSNTRILLLEAELPATTPIRFALIRYSVDGRVQKLALRLDLQKRAFFDHLDALHADHALQDIAPYIVSIILHRQISSVSAKLARTLDAGV